MQFACSYPEMVEKLLVADIAPKHYPPHHHDIINALTQLNFDEISSRGEADTALAQHLSHPGIRQFLLKNLFWIEKGKLALRFNLNVLKDKMEEVGENLIDSSVFKGATLFLRGDRSEYIQDTDLGSIKNNFPNASISTVSNAGHWLHAENPKEFFEKSSTFLQA